MAEKLDPATLTPRTGSSYPAPWNEKAAGREKRALGDAFGLTQFGVNLVRLPPGGWSSQRHWHTHEDEFVHVLEGELTLVSDAGETIVRAGECAGFPAGAEDGHCFINRTEQDAIYLEVGSRRAEDAVHYPDIDLHLPAGRGGFTRKDGREY
ncbi:MAG: cupin domain-containing protein [Alphaproteobacteria bacterium]